MRLTVAELEARIKALEDDLATARQRAEDCQMRMLDAEDDNFHGSKAAVFINALKDRIAILEADLREEQDRRQAMSNQWRTEVEALTARIEELRSDRDCEKRLRKDAEDARERALERVAELESQIAPGRWTPVTDDLPPKNTEVLICFAGQNTLVSTGQWTGSVHDVNGWCYPSENRGATDDGEDPVVTHWCWAPELPSTTKPSGGA